MGAEREQPSPPIVDANSLLLAQPPSFVSRALVASLSHSRELEHSRDRAQKRDALENHGAEACAFSP